MKLVNSLKNKIKSFISKDHRISFYKKSYSQEGEDMILGRIFDRKETGFYVDIGAHHPMRFSNTYHFYELGWYGINIDAMPDSMKLFEKLRPKDVNLEMAISDKKETLTYYMFNEPALNGFCYDLSMDRNNNKPNEYYIVDQKKIQTYPLCDILDRYLPPEQIIDFLSVDVEGFDHKVLMSNNWEKYRPKIILVECLFDGYSGEMYKFLVSQNYCLYANTGRTFIFKLNDFTDNLL